MEGVMKQQNMTADNGNGSVLTKLQNCCDDLLSALQLLPFVHVRCFYQRAREQRTMTLQRIEFGRLNISLQKSQQIALYWVSTGRPIFWKLQ